MALSSLSSRTEYDLFLSFSGDEIRRIFGSHLYRSLEQKGIRVFKDEAELIMKPFENHLAAIRASKIAIVVVSENYVSSPWILRELEEILDLQRSGLLTVFPVYYGVEPCDVLRQAEELDSDQKQKLEKIEISRWINAVMELVCVSGVDSSKCEDDVELILKITNDIWDKLSSLRFGSLVGMDLRMRRMYELLSLESKDDQVIEIGIWGKRGLGKGTLARCVYREISHSFYVCVFLEHSNRIHHDHQLFDLRQELRSELIKASEDTGWLTDQRILLVVESVDTAEQLDILMKEIRLFGPGSRVIVICEDKELLLACGITLLYQVESLEFYEALELLSLCAFKRTDPLIGYEQLLARAIKIGNGYPGVVSAIGSELFGKPKEEWGTVLSKYNRSSDESNVGTEISKFGVSDDEDMFCLGNTESNCVGIDCHLQAVCGLMELESGNEIRIVGIWGVGGVGKKTLARCVYEKIMQNFHTHVFLENVGKIYEDHGPSGLQQDLLWKNIQRDALAVKNSKNSFDVSKARLQNRKVLLIVDGVDNNEQIEDVQKVVTWFGVGSRAIVTTRDENLLVANGLKHVYEVKCLRVHEALQLFYHFAFTERSPSTRFKQLSVRAVQLAGQIPLSLKVLGSCLCEKSEQEWESVLQKLERQQDNDKAKIAEASIDAEVSRNVDKDKAKIAEVCYDVGVSSIVDKTVGSESFDVITSEVDVRLPAEKSHLARDRPDWIPLWGMVSICGERSEMEDAVRVVPNFLKVPIKMLMEDHDEMSPSFTHFHAHFFGVYDGHGGSQVADYCRDRIHFALAEEIERIEDELCNSEPSEGRQVLWEKVFTNCFRRVDDEVNGKCSSPSAGSSDRVLNAECTGSTAVVALVCSSHIIVSNCGDSRAVLFRGKESIPLSVDHKADREDEYERIEDAGGKIIQWHAGARILGILNTSRSIGDLYLKPYLIPDPEVTFMAREKEDECVILASDGLWNVMSNQEACEIARRLILMWHKKHGALPLADRSGKDSDQACQAAAGYLSELALQKGSKDNVSVIVIDLKHLRKFKRKS